MGFGMATNLVKQGYHVKGYDVFPKSVDRFVEAGGVAATSLEDSASDIDHYILMVATAAQAVGVFEKTVPGKHKTHRWELHVIDSRPQYSRQVRQYYYAPPFPPLTPNLLENHSPSSVVRISSS